MRSRRSRGVSPDEVVARHAGARYRVFMLGFLPGFSYMGTVDEAIAMPRHATPRVKVPAGSVGIAGRQTGVYPRESPGGWQTDWSHAGVVVQPAPCRRRHWSRREIPCASCADKISTPVVSGFSRTTRGSG